MITNRYIFDLSLRFQQFKKILSFKSVGLLSDVFKNLSNYLITDLYYGQEPKPVKTNDVAYSFYYSLSSFNKKFNLLRRSCLKNEDKMIFILQKMLVNLKKILMENSNESDLWYKMLRNFGISDEDIEKSYGSSLPQITDEKLIQKTGFYRDKTIDELIESLHGFFRQDLPIINNICGNFDEIKENLVQLSENEKINLSNKLMEILKTFDLEKKLTNKTMEVSSDNNNSDLVGKFFSSYSTFFENLRSLFIPYSTHIISGIKNEYNQDELNKHNLSILQFNLGNEFIKSKIEEEDSVQIIINKIEILRNLLIMILNDLPQLFVLYSSLNSFTSNIFEQIVDGLEGIDVFNNIFGGMGWDLSKGVLKDLAIEKVLQYTNLIENLHEIKEIANLLGRLECAWATKDEWKLNPHLPHEFYDIQYSGDISRIIPSELTKFNDEDLEVYFLSQWLDKRLMSYALKGWDDVTEKESKNERRGPVVICIDTSGSMSGTPEHLAKALFLAILKITKKEKRNVHAILFSGPGQFKGYSFKTSTFDRPKFNNSDDDSSYQQKIQDWMNKKHDYYEDAIDLVSKSFHGGTDFNTPLEKAKEMLSQEEYKKADILFITDGISFVNDVTDQITEEIKKNEARIFSIIVGAEKKVVDKFSDFLYIVNPKEISYSPKIERNLGPMLKKISMLED